MNKRTKATPPAAPRSVRAANGLGSRSKSKAKAPPATFTFASECLVSEAAALKSSLAALLAEPQPVTLDIAALQRIDTAGLQVITAFVRERAVHGRPLEWQGSAPALSTAAQLLGLTSLLKLPA